MSKNDYKNHTLYLSPIIGLNYIQNLDVSNPEYIFVFKKNPCLELKYFQKLDKQSNRERLLKKLQAKKNA